MKDPSEPNGGGKRPPRTLFDEFDFDAPHVNEVRRVLQTLLRESRGGLRKSYLITSASRGEGKSTVSGLLALGAARFFRQRTLLIDTDFRRPTMHQLLGITDRPGLYELLHRMTSVELATRATPLSGLFAIPSGHPSNAGEAYVHEEFAALMGRLRNHYDLILLDAAPVVPVPDPLLMAEHTDGVVVIAMPGKTPLATLRRMKQLIVPIQEKICGVILNNAAEGLPYYYDYRYYGYQQSKPKSIRSRSRSRGEGAPQDTEETHIPAAGALPGAGALAEAGESAEVAPDPPASRRRAP